MESPNREHWTAVKHVLIYLKGTMDYGCVYKRGTELKPFLIGYSDSDFAGDTEDKEYNRSGIIPREEPGDLGVTETKGSGSIFMCGRIHGSSSMSRSMA